MADSGTGPDAPMGQGYPPPSKAPPHPMDGRAAYPGYGPQPGQPGYPPQGQPGYPPQNYGMYPPPVSRPTSGKALTSIILMGVSVLFWPMAVFTGPAALVLGWMALKETTPTGTRTGRGLAIAGMVGGSLMFVACLGLAAIMVFAFTMANEAQKHVEENRTSRESRQADEDLKLIKDRVKLYYIENSRSLEPGGPIVTDGGRHGLYDEKSPRVKDELRLEDLVMSADLNKPMAFYELRKTGPKSVLIISSIAKRELMVADLDSESFNLRDSAAK